MIQGTVVEGEDDEEDVVVPPPVMTRSPTSTHRAPIIVTPLATPAPQDTAPAPPAPPDPSPPTAPNVIDRTASMKAATANFLGRVRSVSDAIKKKMGSPAPPLLKMRLQVIATSIEGSKWVPTRSPYPAHKMTPTTMMRAPPCAADERLDNIRHGNEKLHMVVRQAYDKPLSTTHFACQELSHDITASHKEVDRIRRKAEYTAGAAKVLAESMIDMKFY